MAYRDRGPPGPDYERERFPRGVPDRRERFEAPPERFRPGPGSRIRDHSDDRYDRRPRAYDDDPYVRDRRYYDEPPRGGDNSAGFDRRSSRGYDRDLVLEPERPPPREALVRDLSPPPAPAPRRPAMAIRRQSSLDTFDRRPRHFYDPPVERYGPPARREDYRPDPYAPPPPLPRSRQLPPPRGTRMDNRYADDVRVADPDFYGDEDFRPRPPPPMPPQERVRETEMVRTSRRRHRSPDSVTSRSYTRTSRSSSSSSSRSSSKSRTTVQSSYPKKGKTKIPARLVSKRALIDLRYPFIEEGPNIIILQALGQDNINEVLKVSEEYKKSELETLAARSSAGNVVEERKEEVFVPPPPPPAPATTVATPPPPPAPAPAVEREVVKKEVMIRDVSPSRYSSTTGTSMTSAPVLVDSGPLVHRPRSHSRSGRREVRAEIRALEAELAARKRSRSHAHVGDVVRHAEQLSDGQVVLYEERVERVDEGHRPPRIEKDRKGRMSISVPKHR